MPSPTIRSLSHQGVPAPPRLRAFLSYAHEDAPAARHFIEGYFSQFWEQMNLDPQDAFYDADRLLPGYVWENHLLRELEEADLFVFLVSEHSLRPDHYCMRVEVATAAKRAKVIVPVVLRQCLWENRRIPGAPVDLTFGQLSVLPLDGNRGVKPVLHWQWQDEAWFAVIDGLRQTLSTLVPEAASTSRFQSVRQPQPTTPPRRAMDTDLLPYLCDQEKFADHFEDVVGAWNGGALVAFVKGVYDDNPPLFWRRLWLEQLPNLAPDPLRASVVTSDKVLYLPENRLGAGVRTLRLLARILRRYFNVTYTGPGSNDDVRRAVLARLSEALTGRSGRVKDIASLIEAMLALDGMIRLLVIPEARSVATLRSWVEALLGIIEEIPREDILRRIVIGISIERPRLGRRELAKAWALNRFQRSTVVELGPLSAVSVDHARVWYMRHRLREQFNIHEESVTRLFRGERAKLRLRTFANRVYPLLASR